MNGKYYVYIHYKADTGEPFYVGKGCRDRDTYTKRRGVWWNRTVTKHGFKSERVFFTDIEKEALNREVSLIASMRSAGIVLCNVTKGGEGLSGHKFTEEHKGKLREARKKYVVSDETKAKMSAARKGMKLPPEVRAKISKALLGNLYAMK
jgi:hypothetical protein